jgi:hypothetical protein
LMQLRALNRPKSCEYRRTAAHSMLIGLQTSHRWLGCHVRVGVSAPSIVRNSPGNNTTCRGSRSHFQR